MKAFIGGVIAMPIVMYSMWGYVDLIGWSFLHNPEWVTLGIFCIPFSLMMGVAMYGIGKVNG